MEEAKGLTGIDVAALEKELRSLWQDMSEGDDQQDAVNRTCVQNLIVYAPGADAASEVGSAIATIAESQPSRVLLLLPGTASGDSISAMATAQCNTASRGRRHVCCEQVAIKASGLGIDQFPSAVRPLLCSDLPTALWWRAAPDLSKPVFKELVEVAGRVVIDSSRFSDTQEAFQNLVEFLAHNETAAFSDVTWGRLNPWRRWIAKFYDGADNQKHLESVSRIEVSCGRSRTGQTGLPVGALLTVSWMASRLGWEPQGHFEWVTDESTELTFQRPDGGSVVASLTLTAGEPGLGAFRVATSSGASFSVALDESRKNLVGDIDLGGGSSHQEVTRFYRRDEEFLIGRELELLSRDRTWERAVAMALRLAN